MIGHYLRNDYFGFSEMVGNIRNTCFGIFSCFAVNHFIVLYYAKIMFHLFGAYSDKIQSIVVIVPFGTCRRNAVFIIEFLGHYFVFLQRRCMHRLMKYQIAMEDVETMHALSVLVFRLVVRKKHIMSHLRPDCFYIAIAKCLEITAFFLITINRTRCCGNFACRRIKKDPSGAEYSPVNLKAESVMAYFRISEL